MTRHLVSVVSAEWCTCTSKCSVILKIGDPLITIDMDENGWEVYFVDMDNTMQLDSVLDWEGWES